jgi:hypothetical protein
MVQDFKELLRWEFITRSWECMETFMLMKSAFEAVAREL